jgi:hypothetical protein
VLFLQNLNASSNFSLFLTFEYQKNKENIKSKRKIITLKLRFYNPNSCELYKSSIFKENIKKYINKVYSTLDYSSLISSVVLQVPPNGPDTL